MPENPESMGKEDRARYVLEYMAEHEVAMPPALWYENMKLHGRITFSYDTVYRRIHDFRAVGWVKRHDVDQGIFELTDEGRAKAEAGVSDIELADVIGAAE